MRARISDSAERCSRFGVSVYLRASSAKCQRCRDTLRVDDPACRNNRRCYATRQKLCQRERPDQ